MVSYYPYVIATLLLIYPHSSSQSWYTSKMDAIKRPLRDEKTSSVLKSMGICLSKPSTTDEPTVDILCDRLNRNQKQLLCNEAMKLMIDDTHGRGAFSAFLPAERNAPVPPLAKVDSPHTCIEISIQGYGMKKRMYWCNRAQYKKYNSDEIGQVDGFFISGSRKIEGRAFVFRPSTTNGDKVSPFGKLERVASITPYAPPRSRPITFGTAGPGPQSTRRSLRSDDKFLLAFMAMLLLC